MAIDLDPIYDPNDLAAVERARQVRGHIPRSEFDYPPGSEPGFPPPRPQPAPTGDGPEVLPVVIERLKGRSEKGRRKYGTPLRAHNGRDALQDAIDEVDDQQAYLTQLQMQWPALEARVRHDALEEALQLVEVALQEEGADPATELGRTVAAVNGALRRLHADLRGLQGKPPAAPEPLKPKGRKPHRWEPRGVSGVEWWVCKDCPLERHRERGPQHGKHFVYRIGARVLASGLEALCRAPTCPPPAPKGGP